VDVDSLRNLGAYCAQVSILLAAGGAVLWVLRSAAPQSRLRCWQTLLGLAVLLPWIEPWQVAGRDGDVTIRTGGAFQAKTTPARHVAIPFAYLIWTTLAVGASLRMTLLAVGTARLQVLRRRSRRAPDGSAALQRRLGVRADIRLSDEVRGPVTFGLRRPVVLLPPRCADDESILCHELLHIRRHDWALVLAEECIRALFWFHPLVWWALAEIQLAREETVDREVVRILSCRGRYLEALLSIARSQAGLDLAPAPLFLKKRHLQQRVASLMKEVSMSRTRLQFSLAGCAAVIATAGWLGVRAFPLEAAADDPPPNAQQQSQDSTRPKRIRVGGNIQAGNLIKKVTPKYPPEAKAAGIEGKVRLHVIIAEDGSVEDVDLIEGEQILADAAIPAVRQWLYRPTLLNGEPIEVETVVDVNFTLAR
jgi:TonB family protein